MRESSTRCGDCPFVLMCDLNGCMKESARAHAKEYLERPDVRRGIAQKFAEFIERKREARQ